jgi:hypothetical protein
MECFAIIELVIVNAHHLLCHGAIMVITSISKVLPSSLWNTLVPILLFRVRQAIDGTIAVHILFPNLNATAS